MRTSRSALAITFLSCVENTNVVLERAVDLLHQLENSGAGPAVEIRRRLVGQDDLRVRRQRARDRDPLALSAAQLRRPVARELAELDDVEEPGDALAPLLAARAP